MLGADLATAVQLDPVLDTYLKQIKAVSNFSEPEFQVVPVSDADQLVLPATSLKVRRTSPTPCRFVNS